jgi:hypothetical protein
MKTNAVEVALHRAVSRLRSHVEPLGAAEPNVPRRRAG